MSSVTTLKFNLESAAPIFFGKPVFEKKNSDETHEQFEERTWSLKVHQTDDGQVFIQPFALKNALEAATEAACLMLWVDETVRIP